MNQNECHIEIEMDESDNNLIDKKDEINHENDSEISEFEKDITQLKIQQENSSKIIFYIGLLFSSLLLLMNWINYREGLTKKARNYAKYSLIFALIYSISGFIITVTCATYCLTNKQRCYI